MSKGARNAARTIAPARAIERALELARKQTPDNRIRAVLTSERLCSREQSKALVESMTLELEEERETGVAALTERAYDEAMRSNDGKSWRALEWLLLQHAGHRPGGEPAGQTPVLPSERQAAGTGLSVEQVERAREALGIAPLSLVPRGDS